MTDDIEGHLYCKRRSLLSDEPITIDHALRLAGWRRVDESFRFSVGGKEVTADEYCAALAAATERAEKAEGYWMDESEKNRTALNGYWMKETDKLKTELAEARRDNAELCTDLQQIDKALGILEELPDQKRVLERIEELKRRQVAYDPDHDLCESERNQIYSDLNEARKEIERLQETVGEQDRELVSMRESLSRKVMQRDQLISDFREDLDDLAEAQRQLDAVRETLRKGPVAASSEGGEYTRGDAGISDEELVGLYSRSWNEGPGKALDCAVRHRMALAAVRQAVEARTEARYRDLVDAVRNLESWDDSTTVNYVKKALRALAKLEAK